MSETVPWIELIDRRENWQVLSICGPEHDEILFSDKRKGRKRDKLVAAARELCGSCPVKEDCFSYAVRNREKNGVWGGEDFSTVSLRTQQRHRRTDQRK